MLEIKFIPLIEPFKRLFGFKKNWYQVYEQQSYNHRFLKNTLEKHNILRNKVY